MHYQPPHEVAGRLCKRVFGELARLKLKRDLISMRGDSPAGGSRSPQMSDQYCYTYPAGFGSSIRVKRQETYGEGGEVILSVVYDLHRAKRSVSCNVTAFHVFNTDDAKRAAVLPLAHTDFQIPENVGDMSTLAAKIVADTIQRAINELPEAIKRIENAKLALEKERESLVRARLYGEAP